MRGPPKKANFYTANSNAAARGELRRGEARRGDGDGDGDSCALLWRAFVNWIEASFGRRVLGAADLVGLLG